MVTMFIPPIDLRSAVFHMQDESSKRVLFIHGFTGSPQSFLPQYSAAIDAKYNVSVPLLSGHGTKIEDMLETTYADYFQDVKRAFDLLCPNGEELYVVGLSMGGTLALDLALIAKNVAGMVLINPLVLAPSPYFIGILDQILQSGTEATPGIGSDIADPDQKESSYPGSPVRAAKSLFQAAGRLSERVGEIDIPIRLFSSRDDHVVSVESGEYLEMVNPKVERIILERSYHVATLDYDGDLISSGILDFIDHF